MNSRQARLGSRGFRSFAAVASTAVAVAALAACGSSGGGGSNNNNSGSGGTITLGLFAPFEGAVAASGIATRQGAELAVADINKAGGVNGQKLALKTSNETGEATDASNVIRTFSGDGISVVFGFALTPDCAAAAPVAQQSGVLMFGSCTGDQFRDASKYPNFYSVSSDNAMQAAASAYVVSKNYKPSIVDTFAYDYAEGHSAWTDIQAHLKANGSTFTTPIQTFVPLDSTNYRPQVSAMSSKLNGSAAGRTLFLLTYGSGTITFLKEAQQFSVLNKYEAVVSDGEYYLGASAIGKTSPQVTNSYDYCDYQAYTNAANKKFVSEYNTKFKGYPSDWVEQGYTEVQTLAQAIAKAKSSDGEKVLDTLKSLKVTGTPIGDFDFDATKHEANMNVVSCETVGDAGQPDGLRMVHADFVPTSITFK